MPFLRSLLLLLLLISPVFGQDGAHDVADAKDAAQALALYLDEVSKSGTRPDYTRPPASDLSQRVFNTDALAPPQPAKAGDMPWLLAWSDAANQTNKRIIFFGVKTGADLDQAAVQRNLKEYEDQYAVAMNFMVRIYAREVPAMSLFMDQLTPEQRTPIREDGLQKARNGAAEMISGAIISVAQGMKPANAWLLTASLRDTRDVWAAFIQPEYRSYIVKMVAEVPKTVQDAEVQQNLATFATALAAAK